MLYHLFEILESQFNFPGASLFSYLSFRAAVTVIMALSISIVFGKKIINYLKVKQVGENVRELGLEGEEKKSGTPTMGGIIIIIPPIVGVPDFFSSPSKPSSLTFSPTCFTFK